MKPMVLVFRWILILVARRFTIPVFSAPTKLIKYEKGSDEMASTVMMTFRSRDKTSPAKRRLTKSADDTEEVEGKTTALKRKTTISVNGQLLPIAAVSSTDKNIHVTLQQSPQATAGQLNQQAQPLQQNQLIDQSTLQRSPPQSIFPELTPTVTTIPGPKTFNSSPNLLGPGTLHNSPPNLQGQESLHSPPSAQIQETPSSQSAILQAPGLPSLQGQDRLNSPSNGIPGEGTFHSPPNLQAQGSLSSPLNPLQGQGTLNKQQVATQGQVVCNSIRNTLQPGNQRGTTLVHIGQNSQGELTYKPLGC